MKTPARAKDYVWEEAGEEWSVPWGGSAPQWHGSILPRIADWLPASNILEIAPGFGRWTYYLQEHCEQLVLVDLSATCIEACEQRFAEKSNFRFHVNDGKSLAMVEDDSVDFVFSFDSLVHAPRPAIEAYLKQLGGKLKRDGVGFFHHSNLAASAGFARRVLPARATKRLVKWRVAESVHSRVPDMSAELFRDLCAQSGLVCIRQETVNWRGRRLLDCLSTFVRAGSKWESPLRFWRNPEFMREAELIRQRAQTYPAARAT